MMTNQKQVEITCNKIYEAHALLIYCFFPAPKAKSTCSSIIEPDIDPIAQHRVFKLFQFQSSPLNCLLSFFSICIT